MPTQLTMFADDEAKPDGLIYQPQFISAADEARLIAHVRALPLAPFQFGAYEGKRRVMYFGARYDFTHQRLEDAEALPDWLREVAARVERFAALPAGSIKHALCTEYDVARALAGTATRSISTRCSGSRSLRPASSASAAAPGAHGSASRWMRSRARSTP